MPTPRKLFDRNFVQSLIAVLAGNAIYLAIERVLPFSSRHELYAIDGGLVLDFAICVVCYLVVRRIPW